MVTCLGDTSFMRTFSVWQTKDSYRERMRTLVVYEEQQIIADIEKYDMFETNRCHHLRVYVCAYLCTCG